MDTLERLTHTNLMRLKVNKLVTFYGLFGKVLASEFNAQIFDYIQGWDWIVAYDVWSGLKHDVLGSVL